MKLVSITALGASCEVAFGLRLDTVSSVERHFEYLLLKELFAHA